MKKTSDDQAINIEKIVPSLKEGSYSIKTTNTQFLDLLTIFNNQKMILNLLENKIKYDDAKEKAFNRLYDEMDSVKHDKEFQKIKPLYLDLILLYDRIGLVQSGNNILNTISDELLEILSKQNIERIDIESDVFDLSLQKVVDTQIVEEKEYDLKVIRVIRDGFMYKDKILRVQEVVIGKYIISEEEHSDDR